MKFISWNVNGLRACLKKGWFDFFSKAGADVFCVQETKMQGGQAEIATPGYRQYWNSAERRGYSGTAVFARTEPKEVFYGRGLPRHDAEGRLITLEYGDFYLVNVYAPNAQEELRRLDYRMDWEDCFRAYLTELDKSRPVIVCGDMNVAHREIDLKNPAANRMNPGFTDEERGKFSALLEAGFTDAFRYLYPELEGAYTWWSYRTFGRERNAGWRIDYFLVSDRLRENIAEARIYSDIYGSDHCPVGLELDLG